MTFMPHSSARDDESSVVARVLAQDGTATTYATARNKRVKLHYAPNWIIVGWEIAS